jgi:hypothetical protein
MKNNNKNLSEREIVQFIGLPIILIVEIVLYQKVFIPLFGFGGFWDWALAIFAFFVGYGVWNHMNEKIYFYRTQNEKNAK